MSLRSPCSGRPARRAASFGMAAWGLLGFASALHAEEASSQAEYKSGSFAAVVDFGYGSSAVGDTLLGDLGAELWGIQSSSQRAVLFQWDTLFAVRGGVLGNTNPYTPLVGARTAASFEAGARWSPQARWSFYTGAGLAGDYSAMTRPGTDIIQLRTLNDLDGVGGRVADAALHVDAGASMLDGARSLLLVAFVQGEVQAPGIYTYGMGFAELGVSARFDLAWSVDAWLEAHAGLSSPTKDPSLDTIDQATLGAFSAGVRKLFSNGMWIAVAGGYSREFEHRTYTGNPSSYDTASPPAFDATLFYAVPIGAPRGSKP